MAEMKITNLNVDLLHNTATLQLSRHDPVEGGTFRATSVGITVSLQTPGDQPESKLRHSAIEQAKLALMEATILLEKHLL
jgi:hypothetical protein